MKNLSFEQKYNEILKNVYKNSYEELHDDYVMRYETEQVEDFIDFVETIYECILCGYE